MDIYTELGKLSWKKADYFKWKFGLYVNKTEYVSEEEMCKHLRIHTLNHMRKWEKSQEYLTLVNLYIESQIANDLEQIYKVVSEKAITGDEKSIKLLLDVQKQVRAFNREIKPTLQSNKSNAFDDLEL